jgi:hypothetical protein
MGGNKSLLAERDELHYRSEELESKLAKVCSSVVEDITALESRIRSAEANSVEVVVVGKNA